MPETGRVSQYQEQHNNKPMVEDAIAAMLAGGKQQIALDFAAYLRANKMKPAWATVNSWKATYKGKGICYLRIKTCDGNNRGYYGLPGGPPALVIFPLLSHLHGYEEKVMAEGMQNVIWNNIFSCVNSSKSVSLGKGCNPHKSCAGGETVTVLGKEVTNCCVGGPHMWFYDPNEAVIAGIKKLLEWEKRARES